MGGGDLQRARTERWTLGFVVMALEGKHVRRRCWGGWSVLMPILAGCYGLEGGAGSGGFELERVRARGVAQVGRVDRDTQQACSLVFGIVGEACAGQDSW